jgi:hypothetical protein
MNPLALHVVDMVIFIKICAFLIVLVVRLWKTAFVWIMKIIHLSEISDVKKIKFKILKIIIFYIFIYKVSKIFKTYFSEDFFISGVPPEIDITYNLNL